MGEAIKYNLKTDVSAQNTELSKFDFNKDGFITEDELPDLNGDKEIGIYDLRIIKKKLKQLNMEINEANVQKAIDSLKKEIIKDKNKIPFYPDNFSLIFKNYKDNGGKLDKESLKKKLDMINSILNKILDKELNRLKNTLKKLEKIPLGNIEEIKINNIKKSEFKNNLLKDLEHINILNLIKKENNFSKISNSTKLLILELLNDTKLHIEKIKKLKYKGLAFYSSKKNNNILNLTSSDLAIASYTNYYNYISINVLNIENLIKKELERAIQHEIYHLASLKEFNEEYYKFVKLSHYNELLIDGFTNKEKLLLGNKTIPDIKKEFRDIFKNKKESIILDNVLNLLLKGKKLSDKDINKYFKENNVNTKYRKDILNKYKTYIQEFNKQKKHFNTELHINSDILNKIFLTNIKIQPLKKYLENKIEIALSKEKIKKIKSIVSKYKTYLKDYSKEIKILENQGEFKATYHFSTDPTRDPILIADYGKGQRALNIIEKYGKEFGIFKGNIDNTHLSLEEIKDKVLKILKKSNKGMMTVINFLDSSMLKIIESDIKNYMEENKNIPIDGTVKELLEYRQDPKEIYVRIKFLQSYMIKNKIKFNEKGLEQVYDSFNKGVFGKGDDGAIWDALNLYKLQKENLLKILQNLI